MSWSSDIFGQTIGRVFSKVADWIPGREQYKRNKIDELERKRNELLKNPSTPDFSSKYTDYSERLRKLRKDLENR